MHPSRARILACVVRAVPPFRAEHWALAALPIGLRGQTSTGSQARLSAPSTSDCALHQCVCGLVVSCLPLSPPTTAFSLCFIMARFSSFCYRAFNWFILIVRIAQHVGRRVWGRARLVRKKDST